VLKRRRELILLRPRRPRRASAAVPPTPRHPAQGLKAVMFNWGWHGHAAEQREYDLLMSLEYQARAPCKWTDSPAM
jgi:hypothetical protein